MKLRGRTIQAPPVIGAIVLIIALDLCPAARSGPEEECNKNCVSSGVPAEQAHAPQGDEQRSSAGSSEDGDALKMYLWTWNSESTDLDQAAMKLFKQDVDLLVVCQTEAKGDMYKYPKEGYDWREDWHWVAHGKHSGVTGSFSSGASWNKQYLNIFLRKSVAGGGLAAECQEPGNSTTWVECVKNDNWKLGSSFRGQDRVMPMSKVTTSSGETVLTATTMLHQTSETGKGGVSTFLSFPATAKRKQTGVEILCAHLDAFSEEQRTYDIYDMFRQMRGVDLPYGILSKEPCPLWDVKSEGCLDRVEEAAGADLNAVKEKSMWYKMAKKEQMMHGTLASQNSDAAIIMGDVNYRLNWETVKGVVAQREVLKATQGGIASILDHNVGAEVQLTDVQLLAEVIVTTEGRVAISQADSLARQMVPLVAPTASKVNVDGKVVNGLGFTCNQPYKEYTPTYKLLHADYCSKLGLEMDAHGDDWDDYFAKNRAKLLTYAVECYTKPAKEKTLFHAAKEQGFLVKGDDMQLGWLDRFCFRAAHGSDAVGFQVEEQTGWAGMVVSDHMATAVVLTLSHPLSSQ